MPVMTMSTVSDQGQVSSVSSVSEEMKNQGPQCCGPTQYRCAHVKEPTAAENCLGEIVWKLYTNIRQWLGCICVSH